MAKPLSPIKIIILPVLRCMQICGLSPFTISKTEKIATNSFLTAYTFGLMILCTCISICLIYGFFKDFGSSSNINFFIDKLALGLNFVAYATAVFEAFFKRCHQMDFYRLLIDNDECHLSLRSVARSRSLYINSVLHIIVLALVYVLPFIAIGMDLERLPGDPVEIFLFALLPAFFAWARMAQLITFLLMLLHRNKRLIRYFHMKLVAAKCGGTPIVFDDMLQFNRVYDINCELVSCINETFGWTILVCITRDFIGISFNVFTFFFNTNRFYIIIMLHYSIAPVFNLLAMTMLCHAVMNHVSWKLCRYVQVYSVSILTFTFILTYHIWRLTNKKILTFRKLI